MALKNVEPKRVREQKEWKARMEGKGNNIFNRCVLTRVLDWQCRSRHPD